MNVSHPGGPVGPRRRSSLFTGAEPTARSEPGALSVLATAVDHAVADAELKALLTSMMLDGDKLRDWDCELSDVPDVPERLVYDRARRRFGVDNPDAAAVIVAAAVSGSQRVSEALRRVALSPLELAAVTAEYRLRSEGSEDGSDRVFRASMFNALMSTLTTVLIVRAVSEGHSWWKLAFVLLAWSGYPGGGVAFSTVVAALMALIVSPLVGLSHVLALAGDLLQARAERRTLLARTGVAVGFDELRGVTLRLLSPRGRMRRSMMQRRALFIGQFRVSREESVGGDAG